MEHDHEPRTPPNDGPTRRTIHLDEFAAWMVEALRELDEPVPVYRKVPLPEDALSHALAKAYDAWSADASYFNTARHLRNWLRLTAYWHTLAEFKSPSARRERAVDGAALESIADPHTAPSDRTWSEADCRAVWDCVRQLPTRERFLIEGHYYARLTDMTLAMVLFGTAQPTPAQGLRAWHLRQKAEALLRANLEAQGFSTA